MNHTQRREIKSQSDLSGSHWRILSGGGKLPFPPNYSRVVKRKGSCQGTLWRYVLVKAETKQHVIGSPSPYSCDLSPTLERERRTGREKRLIERGK